MHQAIQGGTIVKRALCSLLLSLLALGGVQAAVDVTIADSTGSSSPTVSPGDTVALRVNVSQDAKALQSASFVVDFTDRSTDAPDLNGRVEGGTIPVQLGALFPRTPVPQTATATAQQVAPGRISVSLVYNNSAVSADGPGVLAVIPIVVPQNAPPGSYYNVRITDFASRGFVALKGVQTLVLGRVGSARITVDKKAAPTKIAGAQVGMWNMRILQGKVAKVRILCSAGVQNVVGASFKLVATNVTPATAPPLTLDKTDVVMGAIFGSWLLSFGDVPAPNTLLNMLQQGSNPVSDYLWSSIPPETQKALFTAAKSPDTLAQPLADALNTIIQGPLIYDDARFADVVLRDSTRLLLQQEPEGDEIVRANRMLIEDAYGKTLVVPNRNFGDGNTAAGATDYGVFSVSIAPVRAGSGPGSLATVPLAVPVDAPVGAVYSLELRDLVLTVAEDTIDIIPTTRLREVTADLVGATLTIVARPKGCIVPGHTKVTIQDLALALKFVANLATPTADEFDAADMNSDGRLSIVDVTMMVYKMLGRPYDQAA
jgi:hypothetical protein